jgi:hypothetical protein
MRSFHWRPGTAALARLALGLGLLVPVADGVAAAPSRPAIARPAIARPATVGRATAAHFTPASAKPVAGLSGNAVGRRAPAVPVLGGAARYDPKRNAAVGGKFMGPSPKE